MLKFKESPQPEREDGDGSTGGFGHNSQATQTNWSELLDVDAIRMTLGMEHDGLLTKKIEMIKALEKFKVDHPDGIISDQDVADATDLGAQLKALAKKVETTRVAVKQPFFDADKAVQVFFRNIGEALEKGAKSLEEAISKYARQKALEAQKALDEKARLDREEALRVEAAATATMNTDLLETAIEAAAAAAVSERRAAAPIADITRTRGDFAVSSGSVKYVYTVENLDLVPREYFVLDEAKIKRAINGKDRLKEIPGLIIEPDYKTTIRS
jgi:hypothetical protein